jgi:hypothetical protein
MVDDKEGAQAEEDDLIESVYEDDAEELEDINNIELVGLGLLVRLDS